MGFLMGSMKLCHTTTPLKMIMPFDSEIFIVIDEHQWMFLPEMEGSSNSQNLPFPNASEGASN
jgi:hypothetical protein